MRVKGKKIMVAIATLIISIITTYNAEGLENYDAFNQILKSTSSVTEETGITMYYKINSNGQEECIKWLKAMNLFDGNLKSNSLKDATHKINVIADDLKYSSTKKTVNKISINNNVTINDEKEYCVEFEKGTLYGYIESVKNVNGANINLFVRKITNTNELEPLYNKIKNSINRESTDVKSYKYLKAKNNGEDINLTQNKISKLLIDSGAENIATVNINKGYSTVAYIKRFTPMKDNGKYIDFNYAVLKDTGENVVILGTPVIDIAY